MRKKNRPHKPTFSEIKTQVLAVTSGRLMAKARLCSHIAKMALNSHQQQLAYHWKNVILQQLLAANPSACIRYDTNSKDDLLLVTLQGHGGLHTSDKWLN